MQQTWHRSFLFTCDIIVYLDRSPCAFGMLHLCRPLQESSSKVTKAFTWPFWSMVIRTFAFCSGKKGLSGSVGNRILSAIHRTGCNYHSKNTCQMSCHQPGMQCAEYHLDQAIQATGWDFFFAHCPFISQYLLNTQLGYSLLRIMVDNELPWD